MALRAFALVAVCCLLLQGAFAASPCGTFGPEYTCFQGLPGSPGYQLCQSTDNYICYTPEAVPNGGAPYGCGSTPRTCTYSKQISPAYSGSKTGGISGDPFLEGFDGRNFDFMGAKDQVFNMITHADYQLNAGFIDAEFPYAGAPGTNGTFIGSVGIMHHTHEVQATVMDDGRLHVVADGVTISPNNAVALSDANVELDAFGTSLMFTSDLCVWKIVAIAPYTWKDDYYKAHIDMQLELLKDPTAMHGVLGQTVQATQGAWPEDDLMFHGEGLAEDYKVSDLLSTDFKFNMFGKAASNPYLLTRARMLMATKANNSARTYPTFARITANQPALRV